MPLRGGSASVSPLWTSEEPLTHVGASSGSEGAALRVLVVATVGQCCRDDDRLESAWLQPAPRSNTFTETWHDSISKCIIIVCKSLMYIVPIMLVTLHSQPTVILYMYMYIVSMAWVYLFTIPEGGEAV